LRNKLSQSFKDELILIFTKCKETKNIFNCILYYINMFLSDRMKEYKAELGRELDKFIVKHGLQFINDLNFLALNLTHDFIGIR